MQSMLHNGGNIIEKQLIYAISD